MGAESPQMADPEGRNEGSMKRRLAATAATAALAISGPATAARPAAARAASAARTTNDPVARVAHSDQSRAATALEASVRAEMASHRHRLAGALAAELGGERATARMENALAVADAEISNAYQRGDRPEYTDGLPTALAQTSGMSESELTDAFEAMSRHARDRIHGSRS